MFFKLSYDLGILFYYTIILLSSFFGNEKAQKWISGRKDQEKINRNKTINDGFDFWIHCSSLGEFEQVRPIIDALKLKFKKSILLSFYSPSGYEIRKDYNHADLVVYLPLDKRSNAKLFIDSYKPKNVIWVKYDFWLNFLCEIRNDNIPIYLIGAITEKTSIGFFKKMLFEKAIKYFNYIFVQDKNTEKYISTIIPKEMIEVVGDPRVDRVYNMNKNVNKIEEIKEFVAGKKVIIGGSTYNKENQFISKYIKDKDIKSIIAPPDINNKAIKEVVQIFNGDAILYSTWKKTKAQDKKILIIDNVGMLAKLYQYADIAIIGGGFGKGIHNILEPACFGLPIFFGPNYHKFLEAREMIMNKGAVSFKTYAHIESQINVHLNNKEIYKKASESNKKYITSSIGAS